MATYNGERYLQQQVDSIFNQVGVQVTLYVYDDHSSDGTLKELNKLSKHYGHENQRMIVTAGEKNVGFPSSFFCALQRVPDSYDFYAYADQDDVWLPNKLSSAVDSISGSDGKRGLLYFEPTTSVDESLNFLFERNISSVRTSFQSLFVRARIAAHTMVFNTALKQELCVMGHEHCGFSHGWLALLIAVCTNAQIVRGEQSHTLHRRLNSSVSAGGKGLIKRLAFEWNVIFHPEVNRPAMAERLLAQYLGVLDDKDRAFLTMLSRYRSSLPVKLKLLLPANYKCDISAANIEAWISCLFSRY